MRDKALEEKDPVKEFLIKYAESFKRVIKSENGIILQPLNSAYSPMIYSNEQIENLPVKIIGKVIELRRKK